MTITPSREIKKWSPARNHIESGLQMLRIGAPILMARHQHQRRRAFSSLASQLGRKSTSAPSASMVPGYRLLSCSRHYSSTSPSSSSSGSGSKTGVLNWYLRKLETRPLITKAVSASVIYTASDITSQVITMAPDGSYNPTRTAHISTYGLIIMGPSQHLWFNMLSRILPKTDVVSILKKIVIGQTIFGPIMFTVFFSYTATLRGENKDDIVGRLKRDLIPTLRNGLMYWPACDFLTFRLVPVHLQPLVNSSFAYLWTIYLTYMASLQKA